MEIRKMIPVILCLSMFVGVNGCSSDEDDSTPEETELTKMEFTTSRITAYGDDWIYFSFKEGKEVNVSEDTHTQPMPHGILPLTAITSEPTVDSRAMAKGALTMPARLSLLRFSRHQHRGT